MITEMKAANALGAKTARACDSCLRRRARWFCAADDAFLCHGCDNLVHSANQLASRHERVRLQTASSKVKYCSVTSNKATPQAWHSGFTRKARTPRHNKHLLAQQRSKDEETLLNSSPSTLPVVPELEGEEAMVDESDEQLLCRVPVLDPFEADLCSMYSEVGDERLDSIMKKDISGADDLDNFSEFLSSDMDLAEFAADVESLLESGFDEDSGEMKGAAELFDCKEEDERDAYVGVKTAAMVKIKDEQVESVSAGNVETKGKIFLRLNYEEVISAWASQGCPWTSGHPPQFNSDECWLDCLGSSGADVRCSYVRSLRGQLLGSEDGGREARVSRYREKRRTRLFAKKIRYEVRKLNAEKRPRMKGRFVKRSSFLGTPSR